MATRSGVSRAECSSTEDRLRLAMARRSSGARSLLASGGAPLDMDHAGTIDALEFVRAERIALRLREVLRQPGSVIAVEVGQAGAEGRDGDSTRARGGDDAPPARRGA